MLEWKVANFDKIPLVYYLRLFLMDKKVILNL